MTIKTPKVSVVIPCYNAMRFLPQTIDSVLEQTCQDFEIIIVDDGSTDSVKQWASTIEDERIHFVAQENQGVATARNTGLGRARGDYIAFLDADDLWHPSKLEKQVVALSENPEVGLVYTWVLLIDEVGFPLEKVWKISDEGNVWERLVEGNIIACGSVPLVRKSCVETVGLFEQFSFGCEDWDYWLRIAARYPFKVIKEILVYYRERPGSFSRPQEKLLSERLREMEESYGRLIERAFASAPEGSEHLKNKSHALASLSIAWEALKGSRADHQYFERYRQRAIAYYPQISLLPEYKKMNRVALLRRLLGGQNYERLTQLSRRYRYL